jgi:transcriptional regulator with XRE-family HTH domain
MDRRDTVRLFRGRLTERLRASAMSQSRFAALVGIDRSTLSQLLADDSDRLPRADTVAAIATALQVSADWLLGLSNDMDIAADILQQSFTIEPTERSPSDALLTAWHDEAVGYKIRHVPSNLPDLLKLPETTSHEYQASSARTSDQARIDSASRLSYSRLPESEMEVCSPLQDLEIFATGGGIWQGLNVDIRRRQIDSMIDLIEELYPTLRWFLFDQLNHYSVPVTIFGPDRAAIYVGQMYFVFSTTEHIRVLINHFDSLIRGAVVQPTEMVTHLLALRERMVR